MTDVKQGVIIPGRQIESIDPALRTYFSMVGGLLRPTELRRGRGMRNVLRVLILAIVLVTALAGVPSVKALSEPQTLEACVDGLGHCSASFTACATRGQCPTGESCICD